MLVPAERRAEVIDILLRIGRGECIREFETRRTCKDGSEIDVALTICPFHNAIGSIVGALVLARSVARRKETDEHFRLAVEASPSGMLQVDQEGTIQLVNAETERMFGYRHEELIGQSVELLLPERFRAEHPTMRAAFTRQPTRRR